jgi:hypothetical protein
MMHSQSLSVPEREHLAALCRRFTVTRVARELGIAREVTARLAAGLPCRAGSVALALATLARLDAALDSSAHPAVA